MKKLLFCFLTLIVFKNSFAQDSVEIKKVAIFAPLYLDTLFDAAGNYKMDKRMPGFVKQGLEFYQGAMMAIDSMDKEGIILDVEVYDTRKKNYSPFSLSDNGSLEGVGLIMGAVSGKEYLDLTDVAKEKKIPFVSVSYPNDGGISDNPYVIIANSKLNTHLQATYNYILSHWGTSKLSLIQRTGNADSRVSDVFKSLNASQAGQVLSIGNVTVNANVSSEELEKILDTERENVLICGSLDDVFAKRILGLAAGLSNRYKIILVGMPSWNSFVEAGKTDTKSMAVVYPATFFPAADNVWVKGFAREYGKDTYTKPTELAYQSFELTYRFFHLLQKYDKELVKHLDQKSYVISTDFDFRPVRWKSTTVGADYFENKRVYILKLENRKLEKLN